MARTKCFDRKEALEKAMEAFWARGYEATSIQDLVDCMGINRGSLYDTFGDKRRLFLEALDQYGAGAILRTDSLRGEGDPREILARFLYVFMQKAVTDPTRRGCFMTNAAVELSAHDDECADRVREFFEELETILQDLISRGQAEGVFRSREDPGRLAAYFVCVMQGLRVIGKVTPEEETLRPMVDVALSVLDRE